MKRELTCIVCPIGCRLEVELEGKEILSVSGNTCPRGAVYAKTECIAPMRTLTTTVRCADGRLLPVKTDRPIPKERMIEAMEQINKTHPQLPICIGDVIIKEIFGAQVIATGNLEEEADAK